MYFKYYFIIVASFLITNSISFEIEIREDNYYIKNIKEICKNETGELISFHKEYFVKKYRTIKSDKFKIVIVCKEKQNEPK